MVAAAVASAGAAAIHFAAVHEHLKEWPAAGAFMIGSGALQLVWAILILQNPPDLAWRVGGDMNVAIVGLWVVSRTVGLPVGPQPWMPEHVHGPDVLATALELMIVVAVVQHRRGAARPGPEVFRLFVFGGLCSAVVAAHQPGHERIIALATLVLALVARSFVRYALPILVPRRNHVHDSTVDAAVRWLGVDFDAGLRAG